MKSSDLLPGASQLGDTKYLLPNAQRALITDKGRQWLRTGVLLSYSADYAELVPIAHLALGDVLRLGGRLDDAAAEWRAMIAYTKARGNVLYGERLQQELAELERQAATAD